MIPKVKTWLRPLLVLPLALLCVGWFWSANDHLDIQQVNHYPFDQIVAGDKTLYLPVSVFGTAYTGLQDDPTALYFLEVFTDTNRDGWPTAEDGSQWTVLMTVSNWDSRVSGILFNYGTPLSTNVLTTGTAYICRITALNSRGTWSADTNNIYWSSFDEANTYHYYTNRWFRFTAGGIRGKVVN